MADDRVMLREQFVDTAQQHEADMMGMYIFLGAEFMLFGGIFATVFVVRLMHSQEVVAASKQLHLWIGAANSVLLLTSSLAIALAVEAARGAASRRTAIFLAGAGVLGIGFLCLKGYEYSLEYADDVLPGISQPEHFSGPVEHLFMNIYLVATALHAIHLTIGIVAVGLVAWRVARGGLPLPGYAVTVEMTGLYWNLVDVIWIFLYPSLYLAR